MAFLFFILPKNDLREEFLRYYNIFCNGADNTDKEEKEEKKEEKEENKKINNIKKIKRNSKNNIPIRIKIENNMENSKNHNEIKIEEDNSNIKSGLNIFRIGNNNRSRNNKSLFNKNIINITTYLNEQKRKQFEENIKLEQINLSFISDVLIKAININIHPSVKKENLNYLLFKLREISTKIILSKDKFDLKLSIKTIDFGPYNLVYGERELLCPESYRKLFQDPQMDNNKEYETIQSRNYPVFMDTELLMDDINNNNGNNLHNSNEQGNDIKIKLMNDSLNIAENKNKKMSRRSSFASGYKNDFYNMENANNTINNNVINQYDNKGTNNRHLNTISNNYYSNNLNNPFLNSRQNILDNSINNINNNNNRKSLFKLTIAKKADNSLLENLEEMPSFSQNKLNKKQKNELDISQAVNNYNSYVLKQRSNTPMSSISPIKIRFNNNKNQPFSNKNIPLNLLEIYSHKYL